MNSLIIKSKVSLPPIKKKWEITTIITPGIFNGHIEPKVIPFNSEENKSKRSKISILTFSPQTLTGKECNSDSFNSFNFFSVIPCLTN